MTTNYSPLITENNFTEISKESSPISMQEYTDAIDEARQQIKDGKSSTIDELEKETENC